jgi:hypothetical protein
MDTGFIAGWVAGCATGTVFGMPYVILSLSVKSYEEIGNG